MLSYRRTFFLPTKSPSSTPFPNLNFEIGESSRSKLSDAKRRANSGIFNNASKKSINNGQATAHDHDCHLEKDIISKIPPSIAITPVLPTLDPEDSLIMGNEELSTIPEKESDGLIKSSVKDLVLIPSESEDTSGSDSVCDLVFDDESLFDEDIPEDNFKIYSNPLFEFDDEYISSDVNPLFDEVLEDIECKDSYDSQLDESTFLVTPLSDSNEDECITPSDDIELLLHRDSSTPMISVVSILEGFTDEPPLEENNDFFDLESNVNEWKKILYMLQLMI
ncbi:hypothetical protein Tco_0700655 [Tanacetum coccineum]